MTIDLGSVIEFYKQHEKAQQAFEHNMKILKCISGGLSIAQKNHLVFDPRAGYWRLPERLLTVAYFARNWRGCFAPPSCVRAVALRLFSHMDRARTDGIIRYTGYDLEEAEGGIQEICASLAEHARRVGPIPEWNRLCEVWPKLKPSAGEDLAVFIENIAAPCR